MKVTPARTVKYIVHKYMLRQVSGRRKEKGLTTTIFKSIVSFASPPETSSLLEIAASAGVAKESNDMKIVYSV